jgi:ABC-type transport system involved in cytochrome c biogenesis permease subunit
MTQTQLAELSKLLYSPVTLSLYVSAAIVLLFALTQNVGGGDVVRGRTARRVGTLLAWAGVGTHVAHEVVRGLAQERLPLGNMFEVTSLMALVGVVGGLWYVRSRGRQELAGFVMLGGTLVLGLALLMYADPGPLMPILDTWWRTFHVSLLVGAMGVFAAGFLFTSLYLLADTGRGDAAGGGRVHGPDGPDGVDVAPDGGVGSAAAAGASDVAVAVRGASADVGAAGRAAMRARIPALKLAVGTFLGTSLVSWVWAVSVEPTRDGVTRMLTVNVVMVVAALVARHFAPYLPSTDVLDSVAHRLIAFAFVLWTVGTIAGAMWAEQSWGRFWGWDPKETGAFLTWIAYAGYLHGRATRGIRGRSAAWIGVAAFITLMATYLVANYVIVGLHSYAGL